MGVFTREADDELRMYDADAFFYFVGALLLTVLIPWTWAIGKGLFTIPTETTWDAGGRAPKDAVVRRCGTAGMEKRRVESLEEAKANRYRLRGWFGMQATAFVSTWIFFVAVVQRIALTPEQLSVFDPFKILGLDPGATASEIKKAYRYKSLQTHPDKDRENPLAPLLFQQVSKAHAALTDETARRNFEKYGNPDGPTQPKVGIALHPAILGSRESQFTFVCVFFGLVISVPLCLVCCCLSGSNLSANGVDGDTLKMFRAVLDVHVRQRDCVSIFASTAEARSKLVFACMLPAKEVQSLKERMVQKQAAPLEPGVLVKVCNSQAAGRMGRLLHLSNKTAKVLFQPKDEKGEPTVKECSAAGLEVCEPRSDCLFSDVGVRKRNAILWAHMWRVQDKLPPFAQREIDRFLGESEFVSRALVSIAADGKGEGNRALESVKSCIRFRQCLVQALDFDDSPLLQLPNVTKLPDSAKNSLPSIQDIIADRDGARANLANKLKFNDSERLDLDAWCKHVPSVKLECQVNVLDEDQIAEDDLGTLTVTLVRANLNEGEASGPIHAPFYPKPKFEEWWVLLYDHRARRLISESLILGTGHREECKIRFLVPRSGDYSWTVHAMCDSYVGLDVSTVLEFSAAKSSEVDRSIFIHPRDMHIQSFFDELMDSLNPVEVDSESEEEDNCNRTVHKVARSADDSDADSADGEESEKGELSQKPVTEQKGAEAEGNEQETSFKNEQNSASEDAKSSVEQGSMVANKSEEEDSDGEGIEPEGVMLESIGSEGLTVMAAPEADVELRVKVGEISKGSIVRVYTKGRPDGWAELAFSNGQKWVQMEDKNVKELGSSFSLPLAILAQTRTSVQLVERWLNKSKIEVNVDDIIAVHRLEHPRVINAIEDMVRTRTGEDKFAELVDDAFERLEEQQKHIVPVCGYWKTANDCLWHVNVDGKLTGVHPGGSRMSDVVKVSENGKVLELGPFKFNGREGHQIQWTRTEGNEVSTWTWVADKSLSTRIRLGSLS